MPIVGDPGWAMLCVAIVELLVENNLFAQDVVRELFTYGSATKNETVAAHNGYSAK